MDPRLQIALESQNPWWFSKQYDTGIPRLSQFPEILSYLDTEEIVLLTGARRTGKSTLVYQIIEYLMTRGVPKEEILYINLDEPLLISMADDPTLLSGIVEEYLASHGNPERLYLCIDEVQNYHYWAYAIKTLYDTKRGIKCILTGSTSSTLQKDISTRLSGRYFSCTIHPLSFPEFLQFRGYSTLPLIEMRSHFSSYLKYGGYPRVVLEENCDLKVVILKNYYETMYLKDIILPNQLRNNSDVVNLLYYLISNVGNLYSYNKIADILHISANTVREYIEYAEDAYLLYTLMKFDYSVKKQIANPKKIYALDTGLVNAVSFAFSENRGKLLENLVFLALKRNYAEVFYHKERFECDFVVKEGLTIKKAVQVTQSLKNLETKKREVRGLTEAMDTYGLEEGVMVTENESDTISIDDRNIHVMPASDWLFTMGENSDEAP